jgi:hypothetical protein
LQHSFSAPEWIAFKVELVQLASDQVIRESAQHVAGNLTIDGEKAVSILTTAVYAHQGI